MNNSYIANNWTNKSLDDIKWTEANIREKIYQLDKLLRECAKINPELNTIQEIVEPLTTYYFQTRYPDMSEVMDLNEEKANDALERAKFVVNFVKEKIENN